MGHIAENKRSFLHLWETSSSAIRFGHISLELNDCYISFWPEKGTTSCQILNDNKCPARWYSTFEEEVRDNEKLIPISLAVFGLDINDVKLWLKKFKSDGPKYDVREQNCASVVYKALQAGSVWFEKYVKDCKGIKTPRQIFGYVKKGYNTNTKIDCGYMCTHCLCLTPYTTFGFFSFYFYNAYTFCSSKLKKDVECNKRDQLVKVSCSEEDSMTVSTNKDVPEEEKPILEDIDYSERIIDLRCKKEAKIVSLSKKTFISMSESK
jgi:hypothetical protein